MGFPQERPRRLRKTEAIRKLVRETDIRMSDLVYPLFVVAGKGRLEPIASLPGQVHRSPDRVTEGIRPLVEGGLGAVLLFGVPERTDPQAVEAYRPDGVVQRAVAHLKDAFPDLTVLTDVCLCSYTDHGHCGLVRDGEILNDSTLEVLARMALSHARAGADGVAPSDMMDGRVGAIRRALDAEGFEHTVIMSYSAKYASGFYGPFREAAHSAPSFGDRRSYQMDPANAREALRELRLDVEEGADILMVKPALPYLDVIHRVRAAFDLPIAAYQVSGEYAMIQAAVERGWADERTVALESLTAIKRAGADLILTYFAPRCIEWIGS